MRNVIKLFSILFLVGGVMFNACKEDPKKDPNNPANWTDPNSEFYRPPVKGVTLSKDTLYLEVGATGTLTATLDPANAYEKSLTWESSETDVAVVDNGTVTSKKAGQSKITVRTKDGNFAANCIVVVTPKMEDNFTVTVFAGVVSGGSIRTTIILPLDAFDDGYSYNWGIPFYGGFLNTSGKTIPSGTPYRFSLKQNGQLVEFNTGDGGLPVTVVSGTLNRDVKTDSLYILCSMNPFSVSKETSNIGANNMTLEVFQMGKKDYSSPLTGIFNYTLELKSGGAPPVGTPIATKTGNSEWRISPFVNVKPNVVVK